MRALVLGGNGFIGSHLVDALIAEGHSVTVVDRCENPFGHRQPGVDYRTFELGNRPLLVEALSGMEVVFHLVSTTVPQTSNENPAFDVQSNLVESIFLLEQCVVKRVKKVVFISSGGTVYGKPKLLPVSEDHQTEPECSYGITKLAIEKYLNLFNHLYGLQYVILRPSNSYGERQNPNGIQGAISVFLGKAARSEMIQVWGDGQTVRDYIYVSDLVRGIYQASILQTRSRVFNLGSGRGCSLNEIIDKVRAVTHRNIRVSHTEARPFDIGQIYLDISRAGKELDWRPQISLDDGIRMTWDFVQKVSCLPRSAQLHAAQGSCQVFKSE